MVRNPFIDDSIVKASDYCQRQEQEKHILQKIKNGHNIAVVGDRRIGKSSTIHHVIDNQKDILKIDMDLYHIRDENDLAKTIIDSVANAASKIWDIKKIIDIAKGFRPFMIPDAEAPLGFRVSAELTHQPYTASLNTAFNFIQKLAQRKKNKIVVFLDEFQAINKLSNFDSILRFMRGKIQHLSRIPFIYAGSIRNDIESIFRNSSSPFFKQAEVYYFNHIMADVFYPFIKDRFHRKKIQIQKKLFHHLFDITYGITGDIQTFCRIGFDHLNKGDSIDVKNFFNVIEVIYNNEKKYFQNIIDGKELTKIQSKVLIYLTCQDRLKIHSQVFRELVGAKSSGTIDKALQKLISKEFIYKHGQEYRFANPFLKEWILDYRAFFQADSGMLKAGIPLYGTRLDFGYRNQIIGQSD